MPAAGGTRSEKCPTNDPVHDSVDVFGPAAVAADGRIVWEAEHGRVGQPTPFRGGLQVGTFARNDSGVTVRPLPYLAPNGMIHATTTHLGWLGPNSLVYVGTDVQYRAPCQRCKLDTLLIGRDIVRLDLSTAPPTVILVPGTAEATSVWPEADGSAIYYTLANDSRVFQQTIPGGSISLVHDFGALGIARDVSVVDSNLVAVVGGRVSYGIDPVVGPLQSDAGGLLYHVDLRTGFTALMNFPGHLARHPVLSPDATRIVAEGYDSNGSVVADLFLLQTP